MTGRVGASVSGALRPTTAPAIWRAPWKIQRVGDTTNAVRQERALHIAYQVLGDGPLDLIHIPGALGHLETYWEEPGCAGSCAAWRRSPG